MATIKYGGVRCLALDTKITVPSIKLAKSGATTQYIPLFKGNKNSEIEYNRWIYTLGGLKVGDYHVATSRRWRNSRPLVLLTASSTNAPNGTSVVITASAFDGDGDTIHYSWSNSGGTASGNTYTVSASNTTKTVTCTVSDDWDGGDSASISVTWYEPNIAPWMSWHTPINVDSPGSVSITANVEFLLKLYYYDADNDNLSWSIYEPTVGSGGVTIENQIASGTFTDTAVINSDGSTNYYSLPITLDYGSIKRYGAHVTDSRGGNCSGIITITTPARRSTWQGTVYLRSIEVDSTYGSAGTRYYPEVIMTGWPADVDGRKFNLFIIIKTLIPSWDAPPKIVQKTTGEVSTNSTQTITVYACIIGDATPLASLSVTISVDTSPKQIEFS
jgi:hypothetical protein